MIVRCPNCGTEFGFDDRQVGEGVTVRCSVCKHVFKLESKSSQPPPGWQIRTTDNMSFTAPDVATLREWIGEGRLTPDDTVSRTGRNWVRLGEMAEFGDLFAGVGYSAAHGVAPVIQPAAAPPAAPPAPPRPTPAAAPPRPAAPPPSSTAAPSAPVRPAPPPSAAPRPVAAVGGAAPQSQRMTVSPPRSSPAQAKAPISSPEDDVDGDAMLEDDELEDDDDDSVTRSFDRAATRDLESRPTNSFDRDPVDADDDDEDGESTGLDAFEPPPAKRGGAGGWIVAGLLVVAVGVVFGVPQIRERVLVAIGASSGASGDEQADAAGPAARPEVEAAEAAMVGLGTAALAQAEASLQRAIDAGDADAPTQAAMKIALADLLVSRALAYQIAAAIDETQREDFRARAKDDHEDGERLLDGLAGVADVDRLAEVRALARLAAGRAEIEVLPMVPDGAAETALIVRAAVLWQNLDAPVPDGLVAGLMGLQQRSGLGESVLGLALLRAGDQTAARNTAERLIVSAGAGDQQVVAEAIRVKAPAAGAAETGAGETGETGEDGTGDEDANVAKAPPPPAEDDKGGSGGGGSGGGGGGGGGFERLLERGCQQVSSGDVDAGLTTLRRAFDINPRDVDVLVCLADGYAAQGSNHYANQFYERALDQAPRNKVALRGAAKFAAKTGATQKAVGYYERLLEVDPNNAAALAYIANNKPGGADKPNDPAPPPQPPGEGGG